MKKHTSTKETKATPISWPTPPPPRSKETIRKYNTTKETKGHRLELRLTDTDQLAIDKIRKKHKRQAAEFIRKAIQKAAEKID